MTELLPCPFCGGPAERVDIDEGENAGGSCICCTSCLASGNVEFDFKENFIDNWNRRHPAPSAAEATGGGVAVPLGAIVNGNILADRVEACDFECVAGTLSNNTDWHEFRRCFNHLAEWAQSLAAPEPPAAPVYQGGSELPMPKHEFQRPHIGSESQPYVAPTAPVPPAQGWLEHHINLLTDGEGDAVTFCSPNQDFNGLPNECVVVSASWTGWTDREFRADTREECLRLAVAAMRAEARISAAIEPAPAEGGA